MAALDKPYLLFLADVPDLESAKTAIGIAHWRPEDCVGECALPGAAEVTLGLPKLDLATAKQRGARTVVLGVVNSGGFLEPAWIRFLEDALRHGFDVASGMHARLSAQPSLVALAQEHGTRLHDVRQPPEGLKTATGRPRSGKRLLTVGTDCSVGKMFTTLAIEQEMRARGIKATFRATGQTGILIAGSGVPIDAVVADFISGAVEQLAPANDPDHWDLIEGQGSLFHPSFAGVSLGLLHGAAPHVMVMCHEPTRKRMRGGIDHTLPKIPECIEANERAARLTNPEARVVAVAVNTKALDDAAAEACLREIETETGLPTVDPVRQGAARLVDAI